ncbi:class I SAM-dependent methyltransferase [Desulfomonile tiedjei]|uniref:Methylase involved in ubiquinone/menaquinone biosynthesis n=1 Tax=Desulfomonile tiedjei (strain ATCC 49306 / DSM 6799 / DCB-1) TaxID=706587 RepID=I4C5Q6_DESTA|nr:class I SAM-dependent methyltransferase [Desulfomonile tiedjei]AFM24897.1 methylase involved in ubiquinone/menaquinone biosynthesis [Desulfomonile tiedjei DSM 6799]
MNRAKAEFFDSQVNEAWAASDYGAEEIAKINRMLAYADLRRGHRVIEPGCGTGRLTAILAQAVGPTGMVLGFEISREMREAALRRMRTRENVLLLLEPVEAYPFAPEDYDIVLCHNVFPHFDDKPAALRCLATALKKGGRFIVFHFMNSAGINDLHRKADVSVLHDMLPAETEMRNLFRAAGMSIDMLRDDELGYLLSATRNR